MTDEDIQKWLTWGRQRLEEMGVFGSPDGLRWAAAHGIVQFVWRNGPIENAHGSMPTKRRKNLHDGVMFARNTWLTRQAFDVLGSDDCFRLLELEDTILDRRVVWPGCDGTLTDFGWGYLGDISKHVKQRTNVLMHFEDDLSSDDFLLFIAAPQLGTHDDHFGMPKWPASVRAAIRRLNGQDEEFLRERSELMERIQAAVPAQVTTDLSATEAMLLDAPWELGAEALNWFAWNPILKLPRTQS
ncbi:hypothetical protein ACWCQK_41145 [Streptomyces sp. NPDC002306]